MFNLHPRRPKYAAQRAKSGLMPYAETVRIKTRHLCRVAIKLVDATLGDVLGGLSWKRAGELAERNRYRQQNGRHWFTVDEHSVVDVLASLIVPSDGDGPGAKESGVVERINRLVAGSPDRQSVYARGLLALDERAQSDYGRGFAQLTYEQQVDLLRQMDRLHHKWSGSGSVMNKIRVKMAILYYKWNGFFWAVDLFPRLLQDVLRVFYTSRVCWDWLDYDGPPMPCGYPDLLERRSPTPKLELETRNSIGGKFVDSEPDHQLPADRFEE
jgi:hypothetical protein